MNATKDLSVLESTLELIVDSSVGLDGHGQRYGSCQYVSGAGTVQVEASNQLTGSVWFIPVGLDGSTPVPVQIAVGHEEFIISGYARIRARKTVGGASCVVALGAS